MNKELKEPILNLIKDLDNIAEVKKVLRVNDITGDAAEIFIAEWSGTPKPEPIYPSKKLVVENKAVEEAPVIKEAEPEILVADELEAAPEPELVAVSAPAPKFSR